MNRTLAEGPEADFIKQMDNPVCVDTGTDFFSLHEDFNLAGFTCRGVWSLVFGLIVIFLIQVFSNQLWTKIGQLERVALTFPAHSAKRASTLRQMMKYQTVSSVIHIVSVLAIMSSNFYILLTIICGNLMGLYLAFRTVKADCSDAQQWEKFLKMLNEDRCVVLKQKISQKVIISSLDFGLHQNPEMRARN